MPFQLAIRNSQNIPHTTVWTVTFVTFAITLFINSFVVAGSDFREGYIVLNSNDTLTGLVDFVQGRKAFRSCHFRPSRGKEVTSYSPAEIKGYGFVRDKIYVSRDVQGNDGKQEKVFLSVIISGLVTLYQLEDAFYLEKNDQILYKLSNEEKESFVDGRTILKKTNQHIAVLNMLMPDLPQLQNEIKNLKLTEEPLIQLVEKYNKFKGASTIIYENRKAPAPDVVQLEAKDGFNHYENLWSKQKLLGSSENEISFNSRIDEPNGTYSFLGGNVYTAKYPVYTLVNPFFPVTRGYFTLGLDQMNSQFSNRFSVSGNSFSPYVNVGFSDNHFSSDVTPGDFSQRSTSIDAFSRNPFLRGQSQFGYWGGIGVSKPLTSLTTYFEIRYEQATGVTPGMTGYYSQMQSNVTNLQVVFGFRRR